MPVFLIPLVAGGYYYYKNMKENAPEEPQEEEGKGESVGGAEDAVDLASSSIEVSLVAGDDADAGETHELRTVLDGEGMKDQQLHRKESSDTANTDLSLDDEDATEDQRQKSPSSKGILRAACGDCDQEGLFEFVECGHSNEESAIVAVICS